MDESQQDEPNAFPKISDRLAFQVDLINVRYCDFKPEKPLTFARNTFRAKLTKNQQKALVLSAVKLGIYSIRPVLMAQKAAQMLSSIDGREEVSNSDLELASVMVLAHRAVIMESTGPDQTDDNIQENKTSENDQGDELTKEDQTRFLQDMIIEAVKAKLPDDLINQLKVTSKGISGVAKQDPATR